MSSTRYRYQPLVRLGTGEITSTEAFRQALDSVVDVCKHVKRELEQKTENFKAQGLQDMEN